MSPGKHYQSFQFILTTYMQKLTKFFLRSEHERHSPFCPFVRGEHTHNVPLSLTCATLPAFVVDLHSAYPGVPYKHPGVPILGRSSVHNAMVVGYSTGLVVVWEIGKQTKVVLY